MRMFVCAWLPFQATLFVFSPLRIWQYLGLDASTMSHHVERSRKILQRKCGCQHRLCINHTPAEKIESGLKREENRHRADDGNLIIINAEWGKRDARFG